MERPFRDSLDPTPHAQSSTEPQGCAPMLVRLGWLVAGSFGLFAVAALISRQPPWHLSALDALYWLLAPAMIALRFLDIRRFGGETADGKPATMGHLKSYAIKLGLLTLVLWVGAHLVQL